MRIAVLRMVRFASLTLLMVVLCSLPGYASDSFKMGVVDPQIVLEKSKAGKRALDGLKEYVTVRQKLLAKDEEDLGNYEKQIKDQLPKMSEAEKKEGFSPQKPLHQAIEQDKALVDAWLQRDWPRIKKVAAARRRNRVLG